MPTNITDVDTFTDPVQAPDDGDSANGATFQLAPQALANRTRYLKNICDVAAVTDDANTFTDAQTAPNWLHATPKTQTRMVSFASPAFDPNGTWQQELGEWRATGDTDALYVPITHLLEPGAEIDEVIIRWTPGAARASLSRMSFTVRHREMDGTEVTVVSSNEDDGSAVEHSITVSSIAHTVLSNREYFVRIVSGNTASVDNDFWRSFNVKQKFSKAGLQT